MQPVGYSPRTDFGIWGRPVAISHQRTNRYNSDVSTADTIKAMRHRAHQFAPDSLVVQAVNEAIPWNARTQRDLACAIFYWVRHHVRFVEDEELLYEQLAIRPQELDKELVIAPSVLLSMNPPQGDCDDFSLLLSSMLLSVGILPYLVTVAADKTEPRKLSHVYVCAKLTDERKYLCLDAGNRLPMVPAGWESHEVTRKAVWLV